MHDTEAEAVAINAAEETPKDDKAKPKADVAVVEVDLNKALVNGQCSKGTTCPKGKVCKIQADCKGEQFRNNVPPSSPASVDGAEETDESIGERIDYASTMEQAYDNLQQMLGEGGMKSLTTETKKLVSQQKNLMSTLNSMAPVLNTAKETLEGMNLPDMGEITTLMKKFTGGSKK